MGNDGGGDKTVNCIEEVKKAFFLSWIGDKDYAERIKRECQGELKEPELKERIREVSELSRSEWEIPSLLRENGINTGDLLRGSILELLERIARTSERREIEEIDGVRYSVTDLELMKIVRGYCERCYGYQVHFFQGGFAIRYEKLIYMETRGDPKEDMRNIIKNLEI
ncbi:MAG: hypothetical protein QXR57_05465 [Metallosphaera sp.]|uniref:hypothetical protein n=1 Tax=Metallosphaera sp. TaxID=2020860 RepID=UPI003169F4CC